MLIKSVYKTNEIYQYIATFAVIVYIIGFGALEGWTSASTIQLMSNETPLPSGQISIDDISWVASLISLGSLICNLLCGYITDHFGRKLPLLITTVPMIISCVLILNAQSVHYLCAATMLAGLFGGAAYTIVMLFLSEIASDNIRGALVSTITLAENVGYFVAYLFGNFFNIYATPKFVIATSLIFGSFLYFCPETPLFLMKQNKTVKAQKSICFYKNLRKSDIEFSNSLEQEMSKIRAILDTQQEKKSLKFSDFTTKPAVKAITVGIVTVLLFVCNGVLSLLNYLPYIFEESGSNLTPTLSTVIVSAIQIVSMFVATQLVDRFGRKPLMIVSGIGTMFGLLMFGTYVMLKTWGVQVDSFNWIPLACLSWVLCISSLGAQTIALTVISEIMPEKIKDSCVSFCMTLAWTISFVNIKYLPFLLETIGLHGAMYVFAGVCLFGVTIIAILMPETKGKSLDEITKSLK